MTKTLPKLFCQIACLFVILGNVAQADTTVAFKEAARQGDDLPGSSLRWNFSWEGNEVEIFSNGQGKVGGKSLQVPLNSTRLTASLRYATYDGDLLLLVEETDEESAGGKLVRFAAKTLKPKWTCDLPSFNVGPGLIEGDFAYLSARVTAMKVSLKNGHWEWRKMNLNRTNESTAGRFNAFGVPSINGKLITFPETSTNLPDGSLGSITLDKANGDVIDIR